jgi:multicomponent Na+:H+ antiporter subunit F
VSGPLPIAVDLTLALLGLGLLLSFARLVLGPTLPDRVVALDLVATLSVGIIAVYTILAEKPILLRAAFVLALLSFLGTVAFAGYLEKRHRGE